MNEEKSTALALLPDSGELERIGTILSKSGYFANAQTAFQAATIVQYGLEIGLTPVVSLQTMSIITNKRGQQKISMEAKAMLALAIKSGISYKILEKTKNGSKVQFNREGAEEFIDTFTIADAKTAELLSKNNWRTYPEEMCFWRCIAKGLRAYAPDVIMGLYATEELQDSPEIAVEAEVEQITTTPIEEKKEEKPKRTRRTRAQIEAEKEAEDKKALEQDPETEPIDAEVVTEKPKENGASVEIAKDPGEDIEMITPDQAKELKRLEGILVDDYGRSQEALHKRVREVIHTNFNDNLLKQDIMEGTDIPSGFTEEQAVFIISCYEMGVAQEEKDKGPVEPKPEGI